MEWISVKDRKPDFLKPVLVCGIDDDYTYIARLISVRTHADGENLEWGEGVGGHNDLWITVTHWMPLPEPIKQ